METKTIPAVVAILVVAVFAIYIIASGLTGMFIVQPGQQEPEGGETTGDAGSGQVGPAPSPGEENKCWGVTCEPGTAKCPDGVDVSCDNACDPATGQCSTCTPDCSGHQAASSGGGGGGGGVGSGGGGSPSCSDTSWSPTSEWSECSPEGLETRDVVSNCGSPGIETRDCLYEVHIGATVSVSPESQQVNLSQGIFTVDVNINATDEVYAIEFRLAFDSSVLTLLNATEGNFLKQDGSSTYPVIELTEPIVVGITRFNTTQGVFGEGTLATIIFEAAGNGTSALELQSVNIIGPGGGEAQAIGAQALNGTVQVLEQ